MIDNNTLKQDLLTLGLSTNEIDVYSALLGLDTASTGPIIEKTQLHRNVVYTALSHLIRKKMVFEKNVRGVRHFSAIAPITLKEEFEEKAKVAGKVFKEISERLPAKIQEITIHQGNEEYLQLLTGLLSTMPKGATKYVVGTGGEEFMAHTMRPIWRRYHKVAHRQNLKIKMIAYENQKPALESDVRKERIYEIHYLPSEMENPSGLHVYPEIGTILNIIYSDKQNPVTAIRIKNEALVQGYLNLFRNLWAMGKEK